MTTPSPTSLPHISKTSSAGDSGRNAGRGTTAAVVGAVIGLVTVAVLGSLIFVLHDEPGLTVHFAGKIALTLVYASPYLFALIASRAKRPATRGGPSVGVRSALISCELLFGGVSDYPGLSSRDICNLVRRGQEPHRIRSPSGGNAYCHNPGISGRRNGRPESLYALRSPRRGDPMLGVVSKRRRTIRMGGPAAQPQRFRHAYYQPKRWKHTGHMQRNHHQRRGRYGRGPSDSCLSGDASDLKVPVAMVAEERSRLGRQVNRTTNVREGFTTGHAAYRTRQIAQGSSAQPPLC